MKALKYFILLLSIFCLFIFNSSCKKEDKKEYQNLKDDTIISSYSLDIDKDGTPDVTLGGYYEIIINADFKSCVYISPLNDYEVAIAKTKRVTTKPTMDTNHILVMDSTIIDSVYAPKVFHLGNIISNADTFTKTTENFTSMISEYDGEEDISLDSDIYYQGVFYIGLRKKTGSNYIYAWIKVRVLSSSSLMLCSCRYSPNCNYIIIIDN